MKGVGPDNYHIKRWAHKHCCDVHSNDIIKQLKALIDQDPVVSMHPLPISLMSQTNW